MEDVECVLWCSPSWIIQLGTVYRIRVIQPARRLVEPRPRCFWDSGTRQEIRCAPGILAAELPKALAARATINPQCPHKPVLLARTMGERIGFFVTLYLNRFNFMPRQYRY